jgi:hypothetical protein
MNQVSPMPLFISLGRTDVFLKSANSWAYTAIANQQISEICESTNFKSENFLGVIHKSQIRKFLRRAILQIANLQTFHYKTDRRNDLFLKFPLFIEKL